jgi:site-specific recombinase XerD
MATPPTPQAKKLIKSLESFTKYMDESKTSYVDEVRSLLQYLESIGITNCKYIEHYQVDSYLTILKKGKYKNRKKGYRTAYISILMFLLHLGITSELTVQIKTKK